MLRDPCKAFRTSWEADRVLEREPGFETLKVSQVLKLDGWNRAREQMNSSEPTERCSASTFIRKMQMRTAARYRHTPSGAANVGNGSNSQC